MLFDNLCFSSLEGEDFLLAVVVDGKISPVLAGDAGAGHLAIIPGKRNAIVATGFQTFHLACLPFLRKGREQVHRLAIALHQHLAYTCCASEVAIYLERWMGIKEVRIGATAAVLAVLVNFRAYVGEQLAVYLVSFVGTMQTSPKIDSPACTPTGGVIALDFQSLGCGSCKFRSLIYRNLVERIESEQVRLVSMMPILVVPIVIPFQQIALLADVVRAQTI